MIVKPENVRQMWCFGDLANFLITSEQTGGTYAMFTEEIWPGGGTPPHIHNAEQEVFYVLEGEMTFFYEGTPAKATPGTLVHIPKGVVHWYQNQSSQNAKMLVMVTPGGFERMLIALSDEVVEGQPRPPVTQEKIDLLMQLAPQHHMSMPEPTK